MEFNLSCHVAQVIMTVGKMDVHGEPEHVSHLTATSLLERHVAWAGPGE